MSLDKEFLQVARGMHLNLAERFEVIGCFLDFRYPDTSTDAILELIAREPAFWLRKDLRLLAAQRFGGCIHVCAVVNPEDFPDRPKGYWLGTIDSVEDLVQCAAAFLFLDDDSAMHCFAQYGSKLRDTE